MGTCNGKSALLATSKSPQISVRGFVHISQRGMRESPRIYPGGCKTLRPPAKPSTMSEPQWACATVPLLPALKPAANPPAKPSTQSKNVLSSGPKHPMRSSGLPKARQGKQCNSQAISLAVERVVMSQGHKVLCLCLAVSCFEDCDRHCHSCALAAPSSRDPLACQAIPFLHISSWGRQARKTTSLI